MCLFSNHDLITQDNPQTLLLAVTLIFLIPIDLLGMRDSCS